MCVWVCVCVSVCVSLGVGVSGRVIKCTGKSSLSVFIKAITNTTPGNNLSTLKQPCMVREAEFIKCLLDNIRFLNTK